MNVAVFDLLLLTVCANYILQGLWLGCGVSSFKLEYLPNGKS